MSHNGAPPKEDLPPPEPLKPHWDALNQTMGMFIGALEVAAAMQDAAKIEPVSGLRNRLALEERFSRINASIGRRPNDVGGNSMLVIDIDNFSAVNEREGHNGGDKKLREVGAAIQKQVREDDLVARLGGGDEIGVLLANVEPAKSAEIAEKIRLGVKNEAGVTLSTGITDIKPHESLEGTLGRADAALYTAKHRGRDQTVMINSETFEQTQITPISATTAAG